MTEERSIVLLCVAQLASVALSVGQSIKEYPLSLRTP